MTLPEIDGLWDYGDPAGSERRFRELLAGAGAAAPAAYRCELLTQIARAACLQRAYPEALALVDRAEALLGDGMARARVRCLLERGRILNDTDRSTQALPLFVEAWEVARDADEQGLAADALHMVAYVTEGEESLAWHRTAIEYCERHEGPRLTRWLCTLHTNMADKYEALGSYDRALEHVQRSLDIARRLDWRPRVLGALCFRARLHRLAGDLPEARRWLAELTALAGSEPLSGYAHEELAECLLLEGDVPGARAQFRRAHELLSADPWFPPTEGKRLARMGRLAAGP